MTGMPPLPRLLFEETVRQALLEDLGRAGDVTSAAVIPEDAGMRAVVRARAPGVVAGMDCAETAFRLMRDGIGFARKCRDGDSVNPGDVLAIVNGPARAVLSAERVALNFLGHLSGVATATRAFVEAAAGHRARIVCTRKTTPGLRPLEKHAVRAGGGVNHRFGLDDGILIKDNHIAVAGGVAAAVGAAKAHAGHMLRIEVEADTLDQLDEALSAGADAVLLDNMSTDELREAVRRTDGQATLEASGGVTLETVAGIAATGVDLISIGWITHSAPVLDLGLDVEAG
jgi:nicotinate-nucleotide pyrophosphorylase (carboxylating)